MTWEIWAAIAIWWSIVPIALGIAVMDMDKVSFAEAVGCACIWPVLAVAMVVVSLYRIPVNSARTIRQDLKNRRLLKEFEEWLERREGEG